MLASEWLRLSFANYLNLPCLITIKRSTYIIVRRQDTIEKGVKEILINFVLLPLS